MSFLQKAESALEEIWAKQDRLLSLEETLESFSGVPCREGGSLAVSYEENASLQNPALLTISRYDEDEPIYEWGRGEDKETIHIRDLITIDPKPGRDYLYGVSVVSASLATDATFSFLEGWGFELRTKARARRDKSIDAMTGFELNRVVIGRSKIMDFIEGLLLYIVDLEEITGDAVHYRDVA